MSITTASVRADSPHRLRSWSRRRVALAGVVIIAALIGLAAMVAWWAATDTGLATLDRPMLAAAQAVRTPAMAAAVTAFTNLGQVVPMFVIALPLTIVLFWRYRRASVWVLMVLAPLGSVTLTSLLKGRLTHPRPPFSDAVAPYETGFSLPSGHTTSATVVMGMLAYLTFWLARRGWVRVSAIVAATTWAVAMGASRIFLGHHWLTDVVFGWLVGLSWLAILVLAHRLSLPTRVPQSSTGSGSDAPS
jgi:membrane-associated phospholipid phosphatase